MKIVTIPGEKYYLDLYEFYQIMGVFENRVDLSGFFFYVFDKIRIGLEYRVFLEVPL